MSIRSVIWAALLALTGGAARLGAQTNDVADTIPPLRPPHAELPPTFWDDHGEAVTLAGAGLILAAAALIIWLLFRPKKPPIPVPPATQARRDLEPLLRQPEDGILLSRVSQILRRYVTDAFRLPPGELTTADFSRAISGDEQFGGELASGLTGFLRECDDRKFAPPKPAPAMEAVGKALQLIDAAEIRREQLRQTAAAAPSAAGGASA